MRSCRSGRKSGTLVSSDVVGPICESGDFFCQDRPLAQGGAGRLPGPDERGGLWLVMASNLQHAQPGGGRVMVKATGLRWCVRPSR